MVRRLPSPRSLCGGASASAVGPCLARVPPFQTARQPREGVLCPKPPPTGPGGQGRVGSCTALCVPSGRALWGSAARLSPASADTLCFLPLSLGPADGARGAPPPFLSFPGAQEGSGGTAAGQVRAYRPPGRDPAPVRAPPPPLPANPWPPRAWALAPPGGGKRPEQAQGAARDLMPTVTARVPGSLHHPHLRPAQPVTPVVPYDSCRGLRDTGGNERTRA